MTEHEPVPSIGLLLPPELVETLRDVAYACVTEATNLGTVFIIKAPQHEIRRLQGNVPVQLRHELFTQPTAPVIRMTLHIYDDPLAPFAMESFINVADPQQREDYAAFAAQEEIYLLFYDESFEHRLSKGVRNDAGDVVPAVLALADELRAAIPAELYDFERAKASIMEATHL